MADRNILSLEWITGVEKGRHYSYDYNTYTDPIQLTNGKYILTVPKESIPKESVLYDLMNASQGKIEVLATNQQLMSVYTYLLKGMVGLVDGEEKIFAKYKLLGALRQHNLWATL